MPINDHVKFEITEKTKVEFLRNACSYPQPCSNVDVIETHMSWVFLTEESAYKLKKIVSLCVYVL